MSRVLSTEQAKSAIQQMQAIINGGFTDQITQLDSQGRTLSDPNVWDGPLAEKFRGSSWPRMRLPSSNDTVTISGSPVRGFSSGCSASGTGVRLTRHSTGASPARQAHAGRPGPATQEPRYEAARFDPSKVVRRP